MRKLASWIVLNLLFTPLTVLAELHPAVPDAEAERSGFGGVANNLFDVELSIQEFVRVLCLMTGVGMLMGAFFQYRKHRQNPTAVRLGTPLMMLLCGVALIVLGFLPFQGI